MPDYITTPEVSDLKILAKSLKGTVTCMYFYITVIKSVFKTQQGVALCGKVMCFKMASSY